MRSTGRYLTWFAAGVLFVGILAACDPSAPAYGGVVDAGMDASLDAGSDAGPPDASFDAWTGCTDDGNDTFETAEDARRDTAEGAPGAIDCPGDIDHFAFSGTEGDFVRLYVRPEGEFMGARLDSVLTLYGVDNVPLAQNNDGMEGLGPVGNDPLIITRLPMTGRYVVGVDEFGHWSRRAEPVGDPALTYDLHVVGIDGDTEDAVVDPETGDDAASATPVRFLTRTLGVTYGFGYVFGQFEDDTDVDVYSFEITEASDTIAFGVTMHIPGPYASGSTTRVGHLWITNATGSEIIARTATATDEELFRVAPTLPNGEYLLFVDGANEPPESNDFYALSITRSPVDNLREMDEAGNGTLAGAESLTLLAVGPQRGAYFLSMLPADDVDYYAFTVPDGFVIENFGCAAAWDGSGVRGLTVELRDGSDAVLASGVEGEAFPAQLLVTAADFGELGAGAYALKIFATGHDPEVSGNWARCGLVLGPA